MTASSAEQMTEAEAEAVLIALGERLKWRQETANWYVGEAESERDTYYAERQAGQWMGYRRYPGIPTGERDTYYGVTLDEVKVACARHEATGKWSNQ